MQRRAAFWVREGVLTFSTDAGVPTYTAVSVLGDAEDADAGDEAGDGEDEDEEGDDMKVGDVSFMTGCSHSQLGGVLTGGALHPPRAVVWSGV